MEKQATTGEAPVDHQGNSRSVFGIVASALAVVLVMVITAAWVALIGYGASSLFHWISG